MIIENNLNVKKIPVSRLKDGECFMYNNQPHIKIDKGCICVDSNFPNIIVNLETNRLNTIGDDILVMPTNAKVVIG